MFTKMWPWADDSNEDVCENCGGSGVVDVTDYDEDGNETWHGTETCPICEGTGKA